MDRRVQDSVNFTSSDADGKTQGRKINQMRNDISALTKNKTWTLSKFTKTYNLWGNRLPHCINL